MEGAPSYKDVQPIADIRRSGEDKPKRRTSVLCCFLKRIAHVQTKYGAGVVQSVKSLDHRLDERRTFFSSRQGQGISVFPKMSVRVAFPIQPPVERLPQALSLEAKRPESEADHSLLLVPRLRILGAIPDLTHMPSWPAF
jgi:hypothetical protein